MSPELEQKLIEKYPVLFQDRYKPVTESCMYFGIEFQGGWYSLLDELCEYITRLSNREDMVRLKDEYKTKENYGYLHVKRPSISFSQIKEKWGLARIYWHGNGVDNFEEIKEKVVYQDYEKHVNGYYDSIQHAIDYVEFLSSKVCEKCGQPGKMREGGWLKVRCDNCYEEIPKL